MSLDGIPGIVDKATTAVSSVTGSAKSLLDSGPVSALSGIVDGVSGALSAISSIAQGLGGLLSGVGSSSTPAKYKLPMKNILHDYATYDVIFSLGCLDANSYNYPLQSYMAGKIPPLLLKSGSGSPNNRVSIPGGKFDFYIDNVVIVGQMGFTPSTANTNSTSLNFKIIEPYSMGMFMIAAQTIAKKQGYSNYNEAPFLLTIEFRGNTETGSMVNVPGSKKFITFKLNTINMKVTAAGSEYDIEGVIHNSEGLKDSQKNLLSDVSIEGRSVQEILQSGPKSLQAALNSRKTEQAKDSGISIPDEILILFPSDSSTAAAGTGALSGQVESKSTATVNATQQISDPKLFNSLGVSRSSQSTNTTLIQKPGDVNALGKASLGFDVTRASQAPFPNANAVWVSDANGVPGHWDRSQNQSQPGMTVMQFNQSSDVINVINQVLLKSDIPKAALDPTLLSKEGMRPWWRIDVQTYHIASLANMGVTGQVPKLIVYRVVPYLVHASRLMAPNSPPPGFDNLKKQAPKQYNYIYTGKNVDLLKFEITIDNSFYNMFNADANKRNDGTESQKQTSGSDKGENPNANTPIPSGGPTAIAEPGSQPGQSKMVKTTTSTDNKGGSRGENEAVRAGRAFQDALLNGQDMSNITFDIAGDPFFITNTGIGNYTAASDGGNINVTKDGDVNYTNGEIDVVINFRTPTDINQATGLYDLKTTVLAQQFSGLYKVNTVTSTFTQNSFTQTIEAFRRPGQDFKGTPNPASLLTSKSEVPKTSSNNTGGNTPTLDTKGNVIGNNGWGEG
jgi:hypothetical protein